MDPVLTLLQDKGLQFTVSGKDYLIKCLNKDHDDTNPSCRVDKISGLFHCFSCGFKGNLFRFYGILSNPTNVKIQSLKSKLTKLVNENKEIPVPKGYTPWNTTFRGISLETLKGFGAFYTLEEQDLLDRIVFPITDSSGDVMFYIGRHVLSNANPRYKIWPRHSNVGIFPNVISTEYKHVFLVEGMFDMLNLYDKGLHNTICVFGTSSLKNNTSEKLLPLRIQGITTVYLLFDGDSAGREAATELVPLIEQAGFMVKIINLPDGNDPGDLTQEYIKTHLIEKYNENSGN